MELAQKRALFVGAMGFSFLPIWRMSAGGSGLNLWQYFNSAILAKKEIIPYPHVTVEEAIENARQAYCQAKGLDYEQSYSDHFAAGVSPSISRRY